MHTIIEKSTKKEMATGLTLASAIDKVAKLYEEKKLDNTGTGISIVCEYAVKTLARYELNHLLDLYTRFFEHRKYNAEQEAYVVTNEEYETFSKTNIRYIIIQ